ncbi:MAG: transposase [Mesorhizobium sp.]|nr:MAG: transposase [Mesorhizobium sp.]
MLLQAFYSIRSERLLMERLEYDLLFRWFVGVGRRRCGLDHSVFSKNRDRLLEGDIAAKFLAAVLAQPKVKRLLSMEVCRRLAMTTAWAVLRLDALHRRPGLDQRAVDREVPAADAMRKRTSTARGGLFVIK